MDLQFRDIVELLGHDGDIEDWAKEQTQLWNHRRPSSTLVHIVDGKWGQKHRKSEILGEAKAAKGTRTTKVETYAERAEREMMEKKQAYGKALAAKGGSASAAMAQAEK